MDCGSEIEPLGKSEGAKEAPSRSIKQFFKLKEFEKLDRQRGETFFDTLHAAAACWPRRHFYMVSFQFRMCRYDRRKF